MALTARSRKGFTLIELLLYVSLAGIILLAVSLFLSLLLQFRVKNQAVAEVEQGGMQAMQIITQTIRNAQGINAPSLGGTAAVLSLAVSDVSKNPTVFDLSGGAIRITEGAGSPVALTSSRVSASSLLFRNLSRSGTPGVLRVQFSVSYVNTSGRSIYDYGTSFFGSGSVR